MSSSKWAIRQYKWFVDQYDFLHSHSAITRSNSWSSMNGLSMFLRVRRLDAIKHHLYFQKSSFFQQETLSSSLHRRHTRRRWGRPIPPEPDTKNVLHNLQISWLLVFSGFVTSSATFHRKYNQVPSKSTCSALLGRAVLLSRLPPSPYIWVLMRIRAKAKVYLKLKWQAGGSTSGYFKYWWMMSSPW